MRPCLSEGASREEIARAAGLTSRTIRLWIGQFNREGLPGLRPHIRKDAGGRRKIVPELAQVIEGLCLRTPPLPVTAIHRSVLVLCQKNKWRAPSYDV
ncbi:helix-turn-helix domain-containing protein, partial [Sphingobium sp. AM]|uniref:helix-turn-helix domain-containing protein n=1 Tax=Sphingobium sp. AM TaxID=1176302 RepID=UPI003FA70352